MARNGSEPNNLVGSSPFQGVFADLLASYWSKLHQGDTHFSEMPQTFIVSNGGIFEHVANCLIFYFIRILEEKIDQTY